jgi:inhibitor of KinA
MEGLAARYASDQSLLLDFASGLRAEIPRLARAIEAGRLSGVRNLHPAYESILVVFDPLATSHEKLGEDLLRLCREAPPRAASGSRLVEIPVCYGGEEGPDLEAVAAFHGITSERVVELHCSAEYRVAFLGFAPGFAYLSGLPEEIATPRLETPRRAVPAGSVGVAGGQAAVYPLSTPGGWRLIGRTRLVMFDAGRQPMSLLAIGDRVRFVPE